MAADNDSVFIGNSSSTPDPWNSAVPQEIISKFPPDWHEKLESKKWQERKEALEPFEKLVSAVRLRPGDYGDLCSALITVIKKDVNIVVVQLAAKVLTGLANGLRKAFSPYAHECLETLLERSREKKQQLTQTIREAIDAIFVSTTLEAMSEHVLPFLSNKNPAVRMETASFLDRCFVASRGPGLLGNKKVLELYVGPLLVLAGDQAGEVREVAFETLGCLHAFAGEKVVEPLIAEIDQIRLVKIHEVSQKRAACATPISSPIVVSKPISVPVPSQRKSSTSDTATSPRRKISVSKELVRPVKAVSISSEIPKEEAPAVRINISSKLTEELMEQLDDQNSYKIRKEAIDKVLEIIKEAKFIQPSLGGVLPGILVNRLKEPNKVLVQSALTVCEQLAIAMGKKIADHIAVLCPAILLSLGDNKPQIRQQAANCMTVWVDQCGGNLAPFLDNLLFSGALQTGNPTSRTELLTWLAKRLQNAQGKLPKNDLIASIPFILSALEDRSSELRKAGQDASLPVMFHTGYEPFAKVLDTLKQASQQQLAPIIEKQRLQLATQSTVAPSEGTAKKPVLPKISLRKPISIGRSLSFRTKTPPAKPSPAAKTVVSRPSGIPKLGPARPMSYSQVSSYKPVPAVKKGSSSGGVVSPLARRTVHSESFSGIITPTTTSSGQSSPSPAFSSFRREIVKMSSRVLEMKASLNNETNVDRIVRQACVLASKSPGHSGGTHSVNVTLLEQGDIFFKSVLPGKRLKFREEIRNGQTNKAHLVVYDRTDMLSGPPTCSDYTVSELEQIEAERVKSVLRQSLGVQGEVFKTRTLIMVGQTRVHVDQVKGLGNFVKLEVVLREDQTAEEGQKIAEEIMRSLNVSYTNPVVPAYVDLLLQKAQTN